MVTLLIQQQATNELLTGLDRVRRLPNVVVLCTSNLLSLLVSRPSKIPQMTG